MKVLKLSSAVSLFVTALLMNISPLQAADYGARINVSSKINTCPRIYKFRGVINSRRAVNLQYRWLRSDGANSPVKTLRFSAAGRKVVTSSWRLGGPGVRYRGWKRLEIVYPQKIKSNRATFNLQCKPKLISTGNRGVSGVIIPGAKPNRNVTNNSVKCKAMKSEIERIIAKMKRIRNNRSVPRAVRAQQLIPLQFELNRKLKQYTRQCQAKAGRIIVPRNIGNVPIGNNQGSLGGRGQSIKPLLLPDLKIMAISQHLNRMQLVVGIKNIGRTTSSVTDIKVHCTKTYVQSWGQSYCFGKPRAGSDSNIKTRVPAIRPGRTSYVVVDLNKYLTVARKYLYNGKFDFHVQVNAQRLSIRVFMPGAMKEFNYTNNIKRVSHNVTVLNPVPTMTISSGGRSCVPVGGVVLIRGTNLGPYPTLGSGNGIQLRLGSQLIRNQTIVNWSNTAFRFRIQNSSRHRVKKGATYGLTLLNFPGNYFIKAGGSIKICK